MKIKALSCLVAFVWLMGFGMPFPLMAEELLKINGEAVSESEFKNYMAMHNIGKSSGEKAVSLCFSHFLFDKLKLADAHLQRWDTLPVFKQELKVMFGRRFMSDWADRQKVDSCYRALSVRKKQRFSASNDFKFQQIFVPLSQHDGKDRERQALLQLDTVYHALLQDSVSESYSWSAPVWASEVELLQEFSSRMQSLSVGQISAPFSSPLGVHIIRLLAKDEVSAGADSTKWLHGVLSEYPERMFSSLGHKCYAGWLASQSVDASLSDSLLVAYWNKKNPSSHSEEVSSGQLADYFREHKKDYDWNLPHFKGGIVYCQNKKDASSLKKKLKKQPLEQWKAIIEQWNKDNAERKADLRVGLFRIGQNAAVDKLVFKCGDGDNNSAYPYAFSLGKCLKRGPESYSDVVDKVKQDYLFSLEEVRIDDLKKRFRVEINQDVLNALMSGKSL